MLNENELRDLSQHHSISYDDFKLEQRLYKSQMNDEKKNLSQATKAILENNFHVAFLSLNYLRFYRLDTSQFLRMWTRSVVVEMTKNLFKKQYGIRKIIRYQISLQKKDARKIIFKLSFCLLTTLTHRWPWCYIWNVEYK